MADSFSELLIQNGVGPVHMNRTRTVFQPAAGRSLPNGYQLYNSLPSLMDRNTAACYKDDQVRWNSEATLWFRGVPRLRPFIVLPNITIPAGVGPISVPIIVPIPDAIRNWAIPPWHTDHVGFATTAKEHSITVQTLKRNFETEDDRKIIQAIETTVVSLLIPALTLVAPPLIPLLAVPAVRKAVASPLVDYALDINRQHFLAGRRSFLMAPASAFGLPGNNWVFETAALEAYSHWAYEAVTDYAMGGGPSAVKPVWVQMGNKVAAAYGRLVGSVEHTSGEAKTLSEAGSSVFWRDISSRHSNLNP